MRARTAVRAADQEHGQLPDGWRRLRNKVFMREVNRPSVHGSEEMLSVSHLTGVTPRSEKTVYMFEAESTVGYKLVKSGDLAINTMWAWMGAAGVSRVDGIVSPAYGVYELDQHRIDPRWVDHVIRAPHYVEYMTRFSRGVTSSRLRLYPDEFLRMEMVIPPLDEQRKIADFLDAETTRIDALVSRRRRQQVVLEQRRDVEARALLVGQNPPGEVALAPLKRRWRVLDCKHRTPSYTLEGYPVVSPGDVTPGTLDLSKCHRFVGEDDFRELTDGRRPLKGDLIYSRNASIGIAAYIATDAPFTMGQDVCLITSIGQDQRYLGHVLNTLCVDQLELLKVGSTFSRVNIAQIQELLIPDREPAEQRRLADELDGRSATYSETLAVLDRAVDLLRERKQALITAAVTGQLDLARAIAEDAS